MASNEMEKGMENSSSSKMTPKDALVMASILKEMGVYEYEPRVINQMLEFSYRLQDIFSNFKKGYISTVLEDARVVSLHASKKQIDLDDVKLAVKRKLDHSFTSPPPREFLLEVARTKNSQPLPLIQDKSGLRLPPDRYCLTGCNYRLKTGTGAQKKQHSSGHHRLNFAASRGQGSFLAGNINKQGANPTRDAVQRNVGIAMNVPALSTTATANEQRNTNEPGASIPIGRDGAKLTVKSEPSDKSSTVASLPSREETTAIAHNQKFPNLLKRKRDGDDDDYDET